jgi:Fic family protein
MTDTLWGMTPDVPKALMLARRQLAEFVCDAVNLEGIPFTLPEIQTLLQGVTVGGHRLSDQKIALNQREAWTQLFAWVEAGKFELSRERGCALHALAAREDALEWGAFRSGGVLIAGTAYTPPPPSDLPRLFDDMVASLDAMADIFDQAIHVFLAMARCQFFYDVNKRMGRFLMNGHLLAHGYPAINLPASRRLEFNELMLDFYPSGDESAMNAFMRSCLDPRIIDIMREIE